MSAKLFLTLGGVVATAAGLHTLFVGGRSLPPRRHADPMVESELRFYAAFYVAFGLVMLHTAAQTERDRHTVNALAGTLLLAGLGRAGAWLATGKPHPFQQALLVAELVLPSAIASTYSRKD